MYIELIVVILAIASWTDRATYIYMANNLGAWFVRHVWCHISMQKKKKKKKNIKAGKKQYAGLMVFGFEDCSTQTCLVGLSSYNMNVRPMHS
jgi:hypothetical protein